MPIKKTVTTNAKKKSASVTQAEQIEQAMQMLDQVASMVTVSKSALTKADRRKAVKMKAGGEKFVPVIASLAKRFAVSIGAHPVNAMTEKMQQVTNLSPLLKRAQLLVTQLGDASLQGNAEVWDSATVLYGTLKRISRRDGDVQTTLAPVEEFFGRRKAAAGTTATKQAKVKAAATSSAPEPAPAASTTTEVSAPAAEAPSVALVASAAPAAH
jgi:hypothetical protein